MHRFVRADCWQDIAALVWLRMGDSVATTPKGCAAWESVTSIYNHNLHHNRVLQWCVLCCLTVKMSGVKTSSIVSGILVTVFNNGVCYAAHL